MLTDQRSSPLLSVSGKGLAYNGDIKFVPLTRFRQFLVIRSFDHGVADSLKQKLASPHQGRVGAGTKNKCQLLPLIQLSIVRLIIRRRSKRAGKISAIYF